MIFGTGIKSVDFFVDVNTAHLPIFVILFESYGTLM